MDEDSSKASKLSEKEKIQKLISDMGILKKALLKERELNKESEEKMREKDIMLRQKTEEVEALQLNNSRLVKRIDSLVEDTKKKNENGPSFINSLLHGRQKDELEKLTSQFNILMEDLQLKIEENEKLHMDIFELRKDKDQKIQDLDKQININKKLQKDQENMINELTDWKEKLSQQIEDLESEKNKIRFELEKKQSDFELQKENFQTAKLNLETKLQKLEIKFKKSIPFDDEKRADCLDLNIPKFPLANKETTALMSSITENFEQMKIEVINWTELFKTKIEILVSFSKEDDQKGYCEISQKIISKLDPLKTLAIEFSQNIEEILKDMFQALNGNSDLTEFFKGKQEKLSRMKNLLKTIFVGIQEFEVDIRKLNEEEINLVDEVKELNRSNKALIELVSEINKSIHEIQNTFIFSKKKLGGDKSEKSAKISEMIIALRLSFCKILDATILRNRNEIEGLGVESDDSISIVYKFRKNQDVENLKTINKKIIGVAERLRNLLLTQNRIQAKLFNENTFTAEGFKYFVEEHNIRKIKRLERTNRITEENSSGISYQTAIENEKKLATLIEKESDYQKQLISLQSALIRAENQLDFKQNDNFTQDKQRFFGSFDLSFFIPHIEHLKEKYEISCIERELEPNYSNDDIEFYKAIEEFKQRNLDKTEYYTKMDNSEDVLKGLQRISMKLTNSQLQLTPLNNMIKNDYDNSVKMKDLYQKTKSKIFQLAMKNQSSESKTEETKKEIDALKDKLSAEKMSRDKLIKEISELEKRNSQLHEDMKHVKANYENQIRLFSDQIIAMNANMKHN